MFKPLKTTPKKDGFVMPPEWELHSDIWILWPERTDNWRNGAKPAQKVFTEIITKIAQYTHVIVGVNQTQFANAWQCLEHLDNVTLLEIANDDSWIRDTGFTAVYNQEKKEIRAVDWEFNAWGGLVDGLYFPWNKDEQVAMKMSQYHNIKRYKVKNFVLEGGSVHIDDKGTILTTAACLLSAGRNPHLSQKEIETYLIEYLGGKKVVWLPHGIYNDETNEHVDNIACFAPGNKILLAWTDDKNDPQYNYSQAAYKILSQTTDYQGNPYQIIKLHIPNPVFVSKQESMGVDRVDGTLPRQEGDRQAASYVNFLISNNTIFLPIFHDKKWDKNAIKVISATYPGFKIEPIYAREIILGGGNIHCIVQQVPKISSLK